MVTFYLEIIFIYVNLGYMYMNACCKNIVQFVLHIEFSKKFNNVVYNV